jgi:hypothetical protein
MRRSIIIAAGILSGTLIAWIFAQVHAAPPPIADIVPAGPLLYLHANDLAGLLHDWNGSHQKAAWLKSANHEVFSQSRLFLRLSQASDEFEGAAGLPPNMDLLQSAAGSDSALALYDIGKLEFLYITRMPSARAFQTLLWQARAKFSPRSSAGIPYFVRQDQGRIAAFAVTNDYFLIATQEDAMAGALAILAGQHRPLMKDERWYSQAVAAAQPAPGDLRMVINFQRVVRSPYFRSYWIEQNITELRQFSAVISDLNRSSGEMRETRVLLRAEPSTDLRPSEPAVARLMQLAPPDAGLYRAWAAPTAPEALQLIASKLLAPRAEAAPQTRFAPRAPETGNTVGTEADLETRIDEPPFVQSAGGLGAGPLRNALDAAKLQAMIQIQSSRTTPDGVFIETPSVIALEAASPWDADAVRRAVTAAAASVWTVSDLGVRWNPAGAGFEQLDGLAHLQVAIHGPMLILGNSNPLFRAVLSRANASPAPAGAAYAARYEHARELPDFERLTRVIDRTANTPQPAGGHQPLFFSENLASLGQTLGRVDSLSIDVHDDGAAVRQLVVYRLK